VPGVLQGRAEAASHGSGADDGDLHGYSLLVKRL